LQTVLSNNLDQDEIDGESRTQFKRQDDAPDSVSQDSYFLGKRKAIEGDDEVGVSCGTDDGMVVRPS
jgi:hypothetical protein